MVGNVPDDWGMHDLVAPDDLPRTKKDPILCVSCEEFLREEAEYEAQYKAEQAQQAQQQPQGEQ